MKLQLHSHYYTGTIFLDNKFPEGVILASNFNFNILLKYCIDALRQAVVLKEKK